MGTALKTGGNLTLKGGCSDCSIALDLYAKLSPYLMSLGLPLCVLGCAAALFNAMSDSLTLLKDTVPIFTAVPPDPEKLKKWGEDALKVSTENLPEIGSKCSCLMDVFALTGICKFMRLIRDTLRLVAALLQCLATLMGDIIRVGIKANLLSQSPDIRIQGSAACLGQLGTNQLNYLNQQMDAVWAIILGVTAVFNFVETVAGAFIPGGYPPEASIAAIGVAIEEYTNKAAAAMANGTDVKLLVPNCQALQKVVLDTASVFESAAAPLTFAIQLAQCP